MNWIKSFNRAMDYIESNITGDLDYDLIAKEAYSSKFHFHRVFSMLAGKSLGEYIRERKLTLAAQDILKSDESIIIIAQQYGYDDPGSFTKAFKRFHGVTPSQAIKSNTTLSAAPPLKFTIQVKGREKMDYRIENKDSFKVIGVSRVISTNKDEGRKAVNDFWQEKHEDGTSSVAASKTTSMGLLGISYGYDMVKNIFRYMIAIEGENTTEKLSEILEIPPQTWAVFPGMGDSEASEKVWDQIFEEWFPATSYQHADAPQIHRTISYNYTTKESEFEVWIPVEPKE